MPRIFPLRVFRRLSSNALSSRARQNVEEIRSSGYTVVRDVFNDKEIETMQKEYNLARSKALSMISQPGKERIWYENGEETRSMYWKDDDRVILKAGEQRYDLHAGFVDGSFFSSPTIQQHPRFEELLNVLLPPRDSYHVRSGFIMSQPESKAQYWHRDTDTLQHSGTKGETLINVDDFYFTALVPLTVDFTSETGQTEFMKGSHKETSDAFDALEMVKCNVDVGNVLLFNGKINHRGHGNVSNIERPALYLVFHKRWYNDGFRAGVI